MLLFKYAHASLLRLPVPLPLPSFLSPPPLQPHLAVAFKSLSALRFDCREKYVRKNLNYLEVAINSSAVVQRGRWRVLAAVAVVGLASLAMLKLSLSRI